MVQENWSLPNLYVNGFNLSRRNFNDRFFKKYNIMITGLLNKNILKWW
jgi:hypothetical protein